ncbi:MAG: hypothetical protein ABIK98_14430 [Pseudomonadota bacterium]|uniref:Uncharacterized protein n=1 Tax=Candidatus Desulfatibia profunda TaxID=2841695 RepID=A0A8J6NSX1_9BACT|nr:hypothetical protein [Candidatus Desulfatibia profunda]MBL7173474.1 hypothetical protein [Desulfobacteraceae bacterium]MBL7179658.1 hypothetical protein [Desulfobacterales bacterium]
MNASQEIKLSPESIALGKWKPLPAKGSSGKQPPKELGFFTGVLLPVLSLMLACFTVLFFFRSTALAKTI